MTGSRRPVAQRQRRRRRQPVNMVAVVVSGVSPGALVLLERRGRRRFTRVADGCSCGRTGRCCTRGRPPSSWWRLPSSQMVPGRFGGVPAGDGLDQLDAGPLGRGDGGADLPTAEAPCESSPGRWRRPCRWGWRSPWAARAGLLALFGRARPLVAAGALKSITSPVSLRLAQDAGVPVKATLAGVLLAGMIGATLGPSAPAPDGRARPARRWGSRWAAARTATGWRGRWNSGGPRGRSRPSR